MKTVIKNKLLEIERSNQIKILYANESGSRAWGFPSPDSDYDVRFIYVKPMESYLSIKNEKDFMSFPINDELDVYGWDLKKVLQLVYKFPIFLFLKHFLTNYLLIYDFSVPLL